MNFKTTYGLFAVLIVVLGLAAWALLTGPKPGDEGLLLPGAKALKLEAKDIDSLTIERKKPQAETLVFTRLGEKKWKLEKPFEARADSSAVERAIDDLLNARRENKDGSKNLADLGLDSPALVVTVGRSGGQSYTVSLGNVTLGGANSEVFALSSDRPKEPLAVRRSSLSNLLKSEDGDTAGHIAKGLSDFRSKEMLLEGAGFNPAQAVQAVRITEGKNEIALVKQPNGDWQFEKPANYGPADAKGEAPKEAGEPGPPTGVEPLITALAAIKPANVSDIVDNATDFANFGLEPSKEAGPKVEITRKGASEGSAITETLLIGKKDDKTGQVFVRIAGEKVIAKVPANLIEPVTKTSARPGNLRDKQLLSESPIGADAIDIKLGGEEKPIELRRIGEPPVWKLYDVDGSSQNANSTTVRDLLTALSGKPVKDFPEPNATDTALGLDHPTAEITLWIAGILPEEKKDDAKDKAAKPEEKKPAPTKPKLKDPVAKLIFGKRDKDLLYVRRITKGKDGKETKADFAVSESLSAKVTRGRMEYVDPVLPSFVTNTVQKLSFTRGPEVYLIEKQDKAPTWIIRQPADRADRGADPMKIEQILSELSRLHAEKLWSEKPSDRELERYGLKSPKLKATVTIKDGDKTSERVYSFGNETDDKSGIYARQSERDLVFVVRKDAIATLESGELQDREIYHLDASKVTGIRLIGWKDVVGQPTTRDLERKGPSNWALKGDATIKLSPSQCEVFLNAVAQIQAEKFVVHKTGPKDEHKLTVPAGALEIVITVEGEKDPVTMTIGGLDPEGRNYFAVSNKLPGDVFLLAKGIFEAVKAKPGFFAAE